MWRAEKAWRDELSQVNLEQIRDMGLVETPKEQIEKSLEWFESKIQ